MGRNIKHKMKRAVASTHFFYFFIFPLFLVGIFVVYEDTLSSKISYRHGELLAQSEQINQAKKVPVLPPLDKGDYDARMNELANNPVPDIQTETIDPNEDSTLDTAVVNILSEEKGAEEGVEAGAEIAPKSSAEDLATAPPPPTLWPVEAVYPNAGAILPFHRVIAYYGNLYSRRMGVLGEYDEEEMLSKLDAEVKKWQEADPDTPVLPALHYIAVVAQQDAGTDGKYRFRMPESEIDKVLAMAKKIPARPAGGNAIVFLDLQVGFSVLEEEIPAFEKYLKMPNVHLGIDPEFSMKNGIRPGKVVGTYDATDINFAINYLSDIVKENNLTPKILVVHRYTQRMVTNYKDIKPSPEVQVLMHMDGWGGSAHKRSTYEQFVYSEPVQFTGFKLFYKNDVFEPGSVLMTPEEILNLSPKPIYIQYQ